ncbi:MAG: SUMF1/EgtB/PvdO family nonheme iron enzyme, partial [Planctomycetota bacterium]|nr:SUMF1/EgtB/PvdO family nonheme iron enzyme [Planctomycetota bacterium]
VESEKVDILWEYQDGTQKAVQVKSSQNPFAKADMEKWAAELEAWKQAEEYELVLLGIPGSPAVAKIGRLGRVAVPPPRNLDLPAFRKQAGYLLLRFLESRRLPAQNADRLDDLVALLTENLHEQGSDKVDGFVTAVLDGLAPGAALADQARCAGLLGSVLRDLEPVTYRIAEPRYDTLLAAVMAIFDREKSGSVPLETRIEAADALGQAGDFRLDFSRDDYWSMIPAGKFLMGAQATDRKQANYDEQAWEQESPVHEVYLDGFLIARYPVTVRQYQRFVDDEGYDDQRWWKAGGLRGFRDPLRRP